MLRGCIFRTSVFGSFENYGAHHGKDSSVILEKDENWVPLGYNLIFKDQKGRKYIAYHTIKRYDYQLKSTNFPRIFCFIRLDDKNGWPVVHSQ